MNLSLLKATSIISRMGIPIDVNTKKLSIIGTSIVVSAKGSSITIKSDKLEELDFGFTSDKFVAEELIQRLIQALMTEASERNGLILEGVFNTIISNGMLIDNVYVVNESKNTTIVIMPLPTTFIITVFQGPIGNGAVKSTIVIPVVNDPVRIAQIVQTL